MGVGGGKERTSKTTLTKEKLFIEKRVGEGGGGKEFRLGGVDMGRGGNNA